MNSLNGKVIWSIFYEVWTLHIFSLTPDTLVSDSQVFFIHTLLNDELDIFVFSNSFLDSDLCHFCNMAWDILLLVCKVFITLAIPLVFSFLLLQTNSDWPFFLSSQS
jgi:hypothetical protein